MIKLLQVLGYFLPTNDTLNYSGTSLQHFVHNINSGVSLTRGLVQLYNLAEKVDECPLNRGRKVLFAYNRDRKNCPL